MIKKNQLLEPKKEINVSDLKKLDKHITENFFYDKTVEKRELEINKDIYWVEGYMCAVWSSPDIIGMDDWLPYINGDCVFKSEKHIGEIMSLIFGLQAKIVSGLNDNSYKPLYEEYNIKDEPRNDLVKKWSKGYIFGTILAHQQIFNNMEIIEMIRPIMMFADDSQKLGNSTDKIIKTIPAMVNELAEILGKVRIANLQKMVSKKTKAKRKHKK